MTNGWKKRGSALRTVNSSGTWFRAWWITKQEIDRSLRDAAPQWPVDQIAPVDKNILRLAIYEMMFDNSAPAKVAITEAIELARLFGSGASPKFVNGVLGAVMVKIGNEKTPAELAVKEVK